MNSETACAHVGVLLHIESCVEDQIATWTSLQSHRIGHTFPTNCKSKRSMTRRHHTASYFPTFGTAYSSLSLPCLSQGANFNTFTSNQETTFLKTGTIVRAQVETQPTDPLKMNINHSQYRAQSP